MVKPINKAFVISVGCGPDQEPLIRAAQNMGFKVIGIDRKNGLNLVDELILQSTFDSHVVLEIIKKHKNVGNINGVLCRASAYALETADGLARFLNLPRFGELVTQASISKAKLHKICRSKNIETIPLISIEEITSHNKNAFYIVKPDIPKTGKKNVFMVNYDKLDDAMIDAKKDSFNLKAIIQPYVDGEDVNAFVAFKSSEIIWYDLFIERNTFVSTRINSSKILPLRGKEKKTLDEKIIPIIKKIVRFESISGFVSFSFRIDTFGNCFLYEMNPGLCGDNIANEFLPSIWDTDFFELDVKIMTGLFTTELDRRV
tara:strand:- start:6610 stop:7557 length:948 start_codon:yes stop_codon:yes gene_type:complete